jgi:hypothetical protein
MSARPQGWLRAARQALQARWMWCLQEEARRRGGKSNRRKGMSDREGVKA